jgi:hypothetical protein
MLFHDEAMWQPPPEWWSMGVVHTELAHVLKLLRATRRHMLKTTHKAALVKGMPATIPALIHGQWLLYTHV